MCDVSFQAEFNRKQEIFEDMFGSSKPVSKEEFKQVYAETGLDIDERMHQFNLYGQSMEESIKQYSQFAHLVPGFYKLADGDVGNLVKGMAHSIFLHMVLTFHILTHGSHILPTEVHSMIFLSYFT